MWSALAARGSVGAQGYAVNGQMAESLAAMCPDCNTITNSDHPITISPSRFGPRYA